MKRFLAILLLFSFTLMGVVYSQEPSQKQTKDRKTESVEKKGSKWHKKPGGKRSNTKKQKKRIKNHNEKKTNIMWKN